MDFIEEVGQDLGELNNNDVKCDDVGWCTVGKKKKPKKRLQENINILPPIFENLSEDEVYFSSSAENSDDDNNSLDSEIAHPKNNSKARIINLNNNNKAASDNKQKQFLSDLNQKNVRLNGRDGQTSACCIAKKLDRLTDKELFIRRSCPKLKLTSGPSEVTSQSGDNHKDGCSQCSNYHSTLSGFVEYFKTRNSLEKPLPELKKSDQEHLINASNVYFKFRTITPASNQSWKTATPSPSHENILPSGALPKLMSLDNSLPSFRPKTGSPKAESNPSNQKPEVSVDKATESNFVAESTECAAVEPKPEIVQNVVLNEKCSKMEKSLQETKLKLQNLYDNLESLKLDSTIHFSKLIEHLES